MFLRVISWLYFSMYTLKPRKARAASAGEGLVVSETGPGVFLQGLAVYDLAGRALPSPNLPPGVVSDAFRFAMEHDVPLSAFLGDVCVTLKMHPELEVRMMVRRLC